MSAASSRSRRPPALYARPRHPYTEALLAAVPKADPLLRDQAAAPRGEVADPANPPPGCAFHPRCPYAVGPLPRRASGAARSLARHAERLPSRRGARRSPASPRRKDGGNHASDPDRRRAAAGCARPSPSSLPISSQSGLVGKLEDSDHHHRHRAMAEEVQGSAGARRLVKAGKLPPVEQRLPQEPMVLKPLRSVGKYGGTWRRGFLGPGDSENGNRMRSGDKLLFWDETGTKIAPSVAKGWEISDGRQAHDHLPAQGHEVVGRRAVHRRRLRVLVRGHVPEQGPDQSAGAGVLGQRQARPHREGRRDHGRLRVRRAALPVPEPARRRHPGRRRPVAPAVGRARARPLCAGALPQEVPAEIRLGRGAERSRPRPPASTTGCSISSSSRTGGSTTTSRRCRRGAWCSRSTARSGCSSAIPTTGRSTPPATSCPTSTRCSSRSRRIPRSSTCAPSPASTTTWSASSISPSCRCSSRTPSAATTRSISIPASTARTPS